MPEVASGAAVEGGGADGDAVDTGAPVRPELPESPESALELEPVAAARPPPLPGLLTELLLGRLSRPPPKPPRG